MTYQEFERTLPLSQRLRNWNAPYAGVTLNDRVVVPSTYDGGGSGWVVAYEQDDEIVVLMDNGLLLTVKPEHVIVQGHDPNRELRFWIAENIRFGAVTEQMAVDHGAACGLDAEQSRAVLNGMQAWIAEQVSA